MSLRCLSLEELLVAYCSIVPMEKSLMNKARHILRKFKDSLDWSSIIRIAAINKVSPQLYHNLGVLRTAEKDLIPKGMAKKLKLISYGLIARNMVLLHELELVLKAFKSSGIEAMLLKGTSLAETVYPKPHLRVMDDIDLLVSDLDTLEKAKSKLSELGFKPSREKSAFVKNNRITIELSEKIGWIIPYLEAESIWKRSFKVKLGDTVVPVMSAEDSLLMLFVHSLFHSRVNLRDLCDALVILRNYGNNIDWNYVIVTAMKNQLVVPMYCYFRLLDQLYNVKAAPEALIISLEKRRMIGLFRLILDKTWSMQDGRFTFIFRLYKKFFFERRRLGFTYPIKYYFSTLPFVIRGYMSRGEGTNLIKEYLPRKLITFFHLIVYASYFGCNFLIKNLRKLITRE